MQLLSIQQAVNYLKNQQIIAYPTESVFGLGCDPDCEQAVMNLLKLKKRSIKKGLILIADNYQQLLPYINDCLLDEQTKKIIFKSWPGPVTWIFPKNLNTPYYLTGDFNSIAIRVTNHPVVKQLCTAFGKPIISTSANLSNKLACKTINELSSQFGNDLAVVEGQLGEREKPSEIRDALTMNIIRSNK